MANLRVGTGITFDGATGNFNALGIGTVRGTLNTTGAINATSGLNVGSAVTISSNGNFGITGIMTASNFVGNGALLTSLPASGITMADMWRLTSTYSIPHNSTAVIATTNWERPDTANDAFGQLGTGMSVNASDHASGIWTFPSTGFYLVIVSGIIFNSSNDPHEVFINIEFTENGSDYGRQTRTYGGGERNAYNPMCGQALVDVTSTSNVKMRLRIYSDVSSSTIQGSTSENRTYVQFYRLGDT